MNDFENMIKEYELDFLQDLSALQKIPSIREESTMSQNAPFGIEIRNVMDVFCDIAKRHGFNVEDDDGYAVHAQIGVGKEYIAALGHLDVVEITKPQEWLSDPFEMVEKDGYLYGRGVNDDKGPLLAALYAARILNDMKWPMRYPIRIIGGGAEETTWECMDHYFKTHDQPVCGFSPDGNFPIVNGEKGIAGFLLTFSKQANTQFHVSCPERINWVNDHMEVRFIKGDLQLIGSYAKNANQIIEDHEDIILIYKGKSALSRNPQRGINVLHLFFKDFKDYPFQYEGDKRLCDLFNDCLVDDFYGEKAGLGANDEQMGMNSLCPTSLTWNESNRELCIDIRFVKSTSIEKLKGRMNELASIYHFTSEVERYKRLLYVSEESELIQALKKAYQCVMKEEAEVFTKGGASYARVLDHGIAFGATFEGEDPRPHMSNENIKLSSLWKTIHIYIEAFKELTKV